jgi:hypothetical protein
MVKIRNPNNGNNFSEVRFFWLAQVPLYHIVCHILQCSAPAGQFWLAPTATQQESVNFDNEIMEIGLICSDLVEKSHHSSNLWF